MYKGTERVRLNCNAKERGGGFEHSKLSSLDETLVFNTIGKILKEIYNGFSRFYI